MADLRAPAETCGRKWLVQLGRADGLVTTSAANCAGACLHFLAVFYTKYNSAHPEETLRAVNSSGIPDALTKFFTSTFCQLVCDALPQFSGYLSARLDCAGRAPNQMPTGWSILREGTVHPILQERTPLHLLTGIFKLTATLRHLDVGLVPAAGVLQLLQPYMAKLTAGAPNLASNWFSRFEARILFWILSLTFSEECLKNVQTFQLAILVCGLLQTPDELLLRELLDNAVFSVSTLSAEALNKRMAGQLTMAEPLMPSSVSDGDSFNQPQLGQILADSLDNINLIKETYMVRLMAPGVVDFSHSLHNLVPDGISTLCLVPGTILPQDWAYLPLLEAYNKAQSGPGTSPAGTQVTLDIRNCLAWLLLCDTGCQQTPETVTARYYRLATVFLCSSDLFLDPLVHSLLAAHLRTITSGRAGRPNLAVAVPGLSSGHEFYLQLLDQFQAVSYGDQLFALYLVLPLSMKQPVAFRR